MNNKEERKPILHLHWNRIFGIIDLKIIRIVDNNTLQFFIKNGIGKKDVKIEINNLIIQFLNIIVKEKINHELISIIDEKKLKDYREAIFPLLVSKNLVSNDITKFDQLNQLLISFYNTEINRLIILKPDNKKNQIKSSIEYFIKTILEHYDKQLKSNWESSKTKIDEIIAEKKQLRYIENSPFRELLDCKFLPEKKEEIIILHKKYKDFLYEQIAEYEIRGIDRLKLLLKLSELNGNNYFEKSAKRWSEEVGSYFDYKTYLDSFRKNIFFHINFKNEGVNFFNAHKYIEWLHGGVWVELNKFIPVLSKIEFHKKDGNYFPITSFKKINKAEYSYKYAVNEDGFICFVPDQIKDESFNTKCNNSLYYTVIVDALYKSLMFSARIMKLPSVNEILAVLDNKIHELDNYQKIEEEFIKKIVNPFNEAAKIRIENENQKIEEHFWKETEMNYFFSQLCYSRREELIKSSNEHQYVLKNIANLSDFEFGEKAELALNRFFQKYYINTKWYNEESASFINPSEYYITWNNEKEESYLPYDFTLELGNIGFYKIEVKASRDPDNTIFYISTNELKELLNDPSHYIIARMVYLTFDKKEVTTRVNEDFGVSFYYFNPDKLNEIKRMIPEWEEYYEEKKIRISSDHLIPIKNNYSKKKRPKLNKFIARDTKLFFEEYLEYIDNNHFTILFECLDQLKMYFNDHSDLVDKFSIRYGTLIETKKVLESIFLQNNNHS